MLATIEVYLRFRKDGGDRNQHFGKKIDVIRTIAVMLIASVDMHRENVARVYVNIQTVSTRTRIVSFLYLKLESQTYLK